MSTIRRRGGCSIILPVSILTFLCVIGIISLWPSAPSRAKYNKPIVKGPTLEELLVKSRMQDSEFKQDMDHVNEPSDGPIERQAASLMGEDKEIAEILQQTTEPAPPQPPKQINEPSPVGPIEEYYDGTKGPRYTRHRQLEEYEDLVVFTIVPSLADSAVMTFLRDLVGGLHQLRHGRHHSPKIEIFTPFLLKDVPTEIIEEISWWNNVELKNIQNYLGLPVGKDVKLTSKEQQVRLALHAQLVKEYGHAIWIKFGYVFEPERISIYKAEQSGSAANILEAYKNGREEIMKIAKALKTDGYVLAQQEKAVNYATGKLVGPRRAPEEQSLVKDAYEPGKIVLEGYSLQNGLELIERQQTCFMTLKKCISPSMGNISDASFYSVFPSDPTSHIGCLVDISEESVTNTLLVSEIATTLPNNATKSLIDGSGKIREVAIAFPTTSKGMKDNEDPVFLRALLPTLMTSVTDEEFSNTVFTIYIGYDHGDPIFEDPEKRSKYLRSALKMVGEKPIQFKMIQLPNVKRVALLWNLLFLHALREGCDYFYQVNDDFRLETSGWLTYFTSTLDSHNGFGVVGPADYHNQLNCAILTQAMVTPVHFEIFGMLYPIELKDWKSDRWLTYVYQPNDTHCRQDIIANNGAAPTRYKHCEFLSYVIFVEAGKRRIAEWKNEKLKSEK